MGGGPRGSSPGFPEDAPAFRPGRKWVSRIAGQEKPDPRWAIRHHRGRAQGDLQEVNARGVEGPPARSSLAGHPFE